MEEYANFGFYYMEDRMIDNPDFFFKDKAFLRVFLQFIKQPEPEEPETTDSDDEIEEL